MKNLLIRSASFALSLILLCQSALYISANAFTDDTTCEIMIYANEEYFTDIDGANRLLSKLVGDNIEIIDSYTLALFGFCARVPASYVDLIDKSEHFDAHICGYFSPLEASGGTYDTSAIYAGEMLNVTEVQKTGYTGSGTIVAVIDNGFDISHEVFSSPVKDPSLTKEDIDALIKEKSLVSASVSENADEIYISEKIPYAFDYTAGKADVSTLENHGTHVAAIIGGKSEVMSGVAPDCQLLLMKVFDQSVENASEYFVAAALEDAIALGADVINLSLGTYSGSVTSNKYSSISRMAKRLTNAGITVVCAAGNSGSSGYDSSFLNDYGIPYPLADMADFGTVGHPGVVDEFIAVGSAENTHTSTDTLMHKDEKGNITRIEYSDTNASQGIIKTSFSRHFGNNEIEYQIIDGLGAPENYPAGTDLTGKIALIERGIITFPEKVNAAAKHGALGAIIYGNDGEEEVYMDLTGCTIPAVYISKEDGEFLKKQAVKSLVFDSTLNELVENEYAYNMSLFSSWGTTPELSLKPDITSVGESIYSATPGNTYASLTGTSMASPFISGMAALFAEKLNREESKYILSKRTAYIKNALMFGATPLINPVMDAEYSPRQQGAGLADISKALNNEILVTSRDNTASTQLEKEDSRYSLEFNVTNLSDKEQLITLEASVLTDTYAGVVLEDGGEEYVFNTLNSKKLKGAKISPEEDSGLFPGEKPGSFSLTLGADKTCSVKLFIELDENEFDTSAFKNGYFIDGFLYARSESSEGSLPFIRFEGDFNSSDIFDADIYSGKRPFFSGNSLMSMTEVGELVTLGLSQTDIPVTPAFSPDSDGNFDLLYLSLSLLRNVGFYRIDILDKDGNTVHTERNGSPLTKGGEERHAPIPVWDGGDTINDRYIFPDGDYTLKITAASVDSKRTQNLSIPFKIDTRAPEIVKIAVTQKNGRKLLALTTSDESLVKSITLYGDIGSVSQVYDGDDIFTFDITDHITGTLWADVTDFALNTKTFKALNP